MTPLFRALYVLVALAVVMPFVLLILWLGWSWAGGIALATFLVLAVLLIEDGK